MKNKLKFYTAYSEYADINDWIEPTRPEWFANALKEEASNKSMFVKKASGCPSFVHLFKNSYTLKTVCDIYMRFCSDGTIKASTPSGTLSFDNHIISDQMCESIGSKISNIKIKNPVTLCPSSEMTMMYLPAEYESHSNLPFRCLTGLLPMGGKRFYELNVNCVFPTSQYNDEEIFIPSGTPYAYLCFPESKPSLSITMATEEEMKNKYLTKRTRFKFDWFKGKQ